MAKQHIVSEKWTALLPSQSVAQRIQFHDSGYHSFYGEDVDCPRCYPQAKPRCDCGYGYAGPNGLCLKCFQSTISREEAGVK